MADTPLSSTLREIAADIDAAARAGRFDYTPGLAHAATLTRLASLLSEIPEPPRVPEPVVGAFAAWNADWKAHDAQCSDFVARLRAFPEGTGA